MIANIEYLDHLLEWAEIEHAKKLVGQPSEWDQRQWMSSCGTACCIAGKVALEQGGKPVPGLLGSKGEIIWAASFPHRGEMNISDFAQEELGLTGDQTDVLFHSDNDIHDIRAVIAAIKDGITDEDTLWGLIDEGEDR